jgi:hypothetical protein
MTVDEVLEHIQQDLDLDAETEHDVLEEIRAHLEEAAAAARAQGLDGPEALKQAAAHLGLEDLGQELQDVHAGWGTADGVIAAALPVLCALVLRWLVFSPYGTADGWQEILARPVFWAVAMAVLLVPLLKLPRWRYALVSWVFFWALSIAALTLPVLRW